SPSRQVPIASLFQGDPAGRTCSARTLRALRRRARHRRAAVPPVPHQRFEQAPLPLVAERGQLGGPLHADQEGVAVGLDRLDDAVGAPRNGAQPLPQAADRLMVHGVHAQLGRTQDACEPARRLDVHRVLDRAELGMAVPDLLAEVIRDVGDEVAAERDVHELHAAADAEDGKFPARERGARERQLEAVALGRDAVVGLVANAAVVRRIDVAHAGGVPLRFDHYRPRKVAGAAPAVVFVHGGAWMHGDPSQAAGNALHLARRGIATISLSYRLAPAHRFPAPLDDVRHGLRWVRAHAGELGIDPERLALLGLSAGAHLALLAHVARGVPELAPDLPPELGDVPEDVRAVVVHYGPFDLSGSRPFPDGIDPTAELLGPRYTEPAWVRLASPTEHAANTSAPVLLIH